MPHRVENVAVLLRQLTQRCFQYTHCRSVLSGCPVYCLCLHSMRSRVYVTEQCPSVCLSQHGPTAENPPLQVCCCGPGGQEMWIDCCSSSVRRASATLSVYVDIAENRLVLCVIFFNYYETRRVVQISAHAKLMYTSDNKRESTLLRVQIPAKAKFAPTCVRNSLLSELS